ncbi:MAG: hypothetical protein IJA49_06715 [Oscillospiraceae bacterium]|nr:hypothetical protein [Oscillospiraceae bacterium]
MKKRTTIVLLCAMTALILDSRCVAESAREALSLCAKTLIPSLFPLFVLGGMLVPGLAQIHVPGLSRILGFPEGYFLLGSLGGYPLGAACIAQAVERREMPKEDGVRMLGLCSLCGPGFLFGVVGAMLSIKEAALIFLMQLEAALATAAFWPGGSQGKSSIAAESVTLPDALNRAMHSMLSVCGWVTLAAVAAGFLRQWIFPFLPEVVAVILTGLLELTNGIFAAQGMPYEAQFVLCALFCSFGGVSVLLQLAGLSKGLEMGQCIAQKALHGLLTALLSLLYLRAGAWSLLLIPAVLFTKIAVEIPGNMVYNVPRKEGI